MGGYLSGVNAAVYVIVMTVVPAISERAGVAEKPDAACVRDRNNKAVLQQIESDDRVIVVGNGYLKLVPLDGRVAAVVLGCEANPLVIVRRDGEAYVGTGAGDG